MLMGKVRKGWLRMGPAGEIRLPQGPGTPGYHRPWPPASRSRRAEVPGQAARVSPRSSAFHAASLPLGDARLGGILRLQPAIDRTRSRLRRRSRVVAPQRSAQVGSDRRAAAATLHGDRLLRKCANRERLNVSCQVMDVSGVASLVECRGGVPRRFAEPRTFSAAALVKLVSS